MTKEERNKKQREYRSKKNNSVTKKYEKTKKGFLMRTYRNMKSRCSGVQSKKSHLYLGKDVLDKNIFYEWSLNDSTFNILFNCWEKNKYNRKLTPSIDRINHEKGYTIENIRWITHSDNSRMTSNRIKKYEEILTKSIIESKLYKK